MTIFKPGESYFCSYPKFVQIKDKTDYNIDSTKIDPTPRPIVILQQIDDKRVIAAPVSSDQVQSHLQFPSYVPISAKDYPAFLKKDSFVKTNQVSVLDVKWLLPTAQPRKVGDLNAIDLDRIQLYSLYATQAELNYAKWISEIVSKNMKIKPNEIEKDIMQQLSFPDRRQVSHPGNGFERGDVRICHFQPEIENSSPVRLYGDHKGIVLTDSKYAHIPKGQTIVVPLIDNKTSNLPFFGTHDVVFGDQRACMSQIQPMNRGWMDDKVASLNKPQMMEIDRSVISTLGLKQQVIDRARSIIQQPQQRGRK